MGTSITNADLTVTITESISLNGSEQGATNTLSITGVDEVFKRIVHCTHTETTTILTFHADNHGAAGAVDLQNAKYIRITNLDLTDAVELAVVGATLYQITLGPGASHMLGSPEACMLAEADASPSFGTMADLASIQVKPEGSAIVDVEVFVAGV